MATSEASHTTMRTRERNNIVESYFPVTSTVQRSSEASHTCTSTPDGRSLTFLYPTGTYESITDVVIPNYAERSAKGEVFNNPMSSIKMEASVDWSAVKCGWYYKSTDVAAHSHCSGFYYQESAPAAPEAINAHGAPLGVGSSYKKTTALIKDAGTQAAAAIDSAAFEGGVFLGELRETISFLRNPLGNFNTFLRNVRRKKNATTWGMSKSVSAYLRDQWLSYRYGIRPMVRDIHDAMLAIEQVVSGHVPQRKTARGYAEDSWLDTKSDFAPGNGRYTFTARYTGKVQVRAGVLYEHYRSPDTFGMQWKDVPQVVWEVIPYSFVIDHFLNVGSFIEAIVPKSGIRQLSEWTTVRTERSATRTTRLDHLEVSTGREGFVLQDGATVEKISTITKTRTPGIVVGLTGKADPFGLRSGDLETAFITDLVALGSQILRSK